MLGIAQKLFHEKGHTLPKGSYSRRPITHSWPLLDRLLQKKCLQYVDYALAETLLPDASEEVAAFICHISIALRAGHVCVQVDENAVQPNVSELWHDATEDSQLTDEEMSTLSSLVLNGAANIPKELMTIVVDASLSVHTPICRWGNLFYFQRYWAQESLFLKNFHSIFKMAPEIVVDIEAVKNKLSTMVNENKLKPEQSLAILSACQNALTIICGGPGTGKTYTAGQLIKCLWDAMPKHRQKKCDIMLAAPTGKAASQLYSSLKHAVKDVEGFPDIQAKTLHALLGIRGSKMSHKDEEPFISADIIVIDESSMIDLHLFSVLLSAIKPGARLILLGDHHQLPPISVGMLFADLVNLLHKDEASNLTMLNKCLRTELQQIVDFASNIKEGRVQNVFETLQEGIIIIKELNESDNRALTSIQQELLSYAGPHFLQIIKKQSDPTQLFKGFNQFRILSPMRQGHLGVDALNELFVKHLFAHMHEKDFIVPIMIASNDHRLELFNGEIGLLFRHAVTKQNLHEVQVGDYALFSQKNGVGEELRKIPALLLPKYEYAYCLSVHKSQGSEFDRVLLLLPEGSDAFGREVLYTGVTRAKKQLEIWGNREVVRKTIERAAHRHSGVERRMSIFTTENTEDTEK